MICINKNHDKYLEDTILSIFSQKFDNFELIIADGGSSDKSLDIINKYPFIRLLSGQDSGQETGLLRALAAAKGRYVMVTTSTDGYLSRNWFSSAFTLLESDSQVSLTYGASATMSSEGSLGPVTYPAQFKLYDEQPKGILNRLWLEHGFGKSYFPELNYCVRIDIFQKLMGPSTEYPELNEIDPILRFHFEFNRLGYISSYLPIVANFGRTHANQAQFSEKNYFYLRVYEENWKKYRKDFISGKINHILRDANGQPFGRFNLEVAAFDTVPPSPTVNACELNPARSPLPVPVDGELSLRAAEANLGDTMELARTLVRPGNLVFDAGANIGNKAELFLGLGAHVVCFEPQPDCADILMRKFGNSDRVTVVQKGLAERAGTLSLSVCSQANTISTFSETWKQGRFSNYCWDRQVSVEVITLDEAIRSYGHPDYLKIDVEGFEWEVLRGLSSPVPLLSFEFASECLNRACLCLDHLESLGYREFNFSVGESGRFAFLKYMSKVSLIQCLRDAPDPLLWGDIYARFPTTEKLNTASPIGMGFPEGTPVALEEIHDFNQRARNRWMRSKASSVAQGLRVLDIGAGTCLYRPLFAHCEYRTQDFKKYEGSEYGQIDYVSDITAIPVPNHSFHVVVCTEVLEHTPEPILVLKEISRILKPGGRAFITAPLGSGLHQLPYHFYGGYTPEWYKRFGRACGLSPIEITPNGGFMKHLAQECARAAGFWTNQPHLHGADAQEIFHYLYEKLPRLLFAIDDACFIDKFTVGYFVEFVKEDRPTEDACARTEKSGSGGATRLDAKLKEKGLWNSAGPLRLHLGCGEQRLEGYINIDYPSDQHRVMHPAVDHEADIRELSCADNVVDEIRLHHVFEHFNRVQALALLIRWHRWLKMGGRLHIETPDLMGSAETLLSETTPKTRLGVVRHLVGDQADTWAYHVDQWYEERFRLTLCKLGFTIVSVRNWRWPHEPFLANIEVVAEKSAMRTLTEQLEAAKELLRGAMVSEAEQTTHAVWCGQIMALFVDDQILKDEAPPQVAVKLMGGLGNQMFQFAAGLALAQRLGARLKLDLSFLNSQSTQRPGFTPRNYELDAFRLVSDCKTVPGADVLGRALPKRVEKNFRFDSGFYEWGNSYLDGYWQSPKYFESVTEILQEAFTLRTPLPLARQALAVQIGQSNAVCVHVRRGDMVNDATTHAFHGVCDLAYYQEACALLARAYPDAHFYLFSDAPDWCRSVDLTGGHPNTLISDGGLPAEDFVLMRLCRHFIIANSSLSWWAAYLGQSPDKQVIAPEPWFDNPDLDTSDLLPESWTRLRKSPGKPSPTVSVIIPCYNQAHFLPEAVASVIDQTFPNWEILIVNDGSPDDTSVIAKQLIKFYPSYRIRLIEKYNGGLSDARNAGIRAARGKYILPLDADDKLHPRMLEKTAALLESNSNISIAYVNYCHFGTTSGIVNLGEIFQLNDIRAVDKLAYCSLYRKEIWQTVGGYKLNMIYGYEDWDFWISRTERGYNAKRCPDPEPLFFYRTKDSSMLGSVIN